MSTQCTHAGVVSREECPYCNPAPAAVVPARRPAPSLYVIEEDLQALLDSEDLVDPADRQAFEADLADAMRAAVDKRQRVGEFIRYCQTHQEACRAEIERLTRLYDFYVKAQARMETIVLRVIESLGTDAKGKYKTLEAHTFKFRAQRNPSTTVITDAAKVPDGFKRMRIGFALPKWAWMQVEADLKRLVTEQVPSCEISASEDIPLTPIKRAIEEDCQEVPGADVKIGDLRLVVK